MWFRINWSFRELALGANISSFLRQEDPDMTEKISIFLIDEQAHMAPKSKPVCLAMFNQAGRNDDFVDAPTGLFFCLEKDLGPIQKNH